MTTGFMKKEKMVLDKGFSEASRQKNEKQRNCGKFFEKSIDFMSKTSYNG